jgi:hypothetical protein
VARHSWCTSSTADDGIDLTGASMSNPSAQSRRTARRFAVASLVGGLLVGGLGATAQAKDGLGGTTGGTATCNPVTALSYKGDANPAESGIPTITVTYAVKPCVKGQNVIVGTNLHLSADPSVVPYSVTPSPLSGKYVVTGVLANTSYQAEIVVTDAATGQVLGTRWIWAAANYQGV